MTLLRLVLLFTLITLSGSVAMHAQEVTYSRFEKFDFRNGDYAVVGITGGYLYNYQSSTEGAYLSSFDDSMNKVATVILDFFPAKIYATKFIAYADRIIILYQALESNKVVQYAALLDEHARLVSRPVQLGVAKPGIFGAMKSYFYSAVSEDKKSILIYSLLDKAGGLEFEGKWLDDSARLQKRCKATFKPGIDITSGDVNIANDGTVYMAAYTTVGFEEYADQFWVLKLPPGETKFIDFQMNLDHKFVTGGYLKVDNLNQELYFGGYYAGRKNGGYDGIVFAAFDMGKADFEQIKYLPFEEELTDVSGRTLRPHSFDNYLVKQIIVKNDGGFVMVSENSLITSRTNYSPSLGYYGTMYGGPYTTSWIKEYHFNDILALSYDKNGAKEWAAVIPKQQFSQEDGGVFSSYGLLNSGGSLAFLFNDFNVSKSRIQLATLDANGKMQINSFTAEGNDNPDWLPRVGKQVGARSFVVPCLHKRQICYAKVVF
jgi:hypothetical protein